MMRIKFRLKLSKNSRTLILIWMGVGALLPLFALFKDLNTQDLMITIPNIIKLHQLNPMHYFIDAVPLMMGIFTYFRVCDQEVTEEIINALTTTSQNLEDEKRKNQATGLQLANILIKSPISYVIIESSGNIKYANPATKSVYGSADTVGQNILNFNTVAETPMANMIRNAISGEYAELNAYQHISATTGDHKFLDITFIPFEKSGHSYLYDVLMITADITTEKQLIAQIEDSYFNIIKGLAKALDARDTYTSQHSVKVREYTELILNYLEIGDEDKKEILIAAELHDIGKLGIEDAILRKNGPLSDDEFVLMKQHPVIGAEFFDELDGYQNISKIIKHHHERLDGTGYPSGLTDSKIPLGSKVIAIADAFDAMITDRIYRKALSYERAISELINGKGTQFHPELVDLFVQNYSSVSDQPCEQEMKGRHCQ